jgi:predicted HAD superfamily Cof-like phosphohydrolase
MSYKTNNEMYHMVEEFHKAFGHPVAQKPTTMSLDRRENRYKWIKEEIGEFLESEQLVDQVDGLIDAMYLIQGTLVELGVKPYKPFKIVQSANMNKLFPDGKPRYKEDGKIKKPDNWLPPEPMLQMEIERQIKAANNN